MSGPNRKTARYDSRAARCSVMASSSISSHISFDMGVSVATRVATIAPIINSMIEEHDKEDSALGVEAFQEDMIGRIRAAGLLVPKWIELEFVGVHPDNREKAMLVPIDVHDLLRRIAEDGWSYKKWDALACEIPEGPLGQDWRQQNEALAKASDGLLAPYQGDMLTVLTGRGSHGTAAVRAMKMATKGIHPEVCVDGYVSKSKICERQPSMEQPLAKGCPYDVLKAELVVACPRLMEVLSRTGNAGHNVFRVQTTLQHCNRIHQLAVNRQQANKSLEWEAIAKQACIGMGADFFEDAKKLSEFVRVWSGGEDGHILKDLESYERTLKVKRKLYPHDLQSLSKLDFVDAPRYIPAMVKAMLNAPQADSTGHANLFTNGDFNSLQANGKARPFAKETNDIINAASSFLNAYGRFTPTMQAKLLSDLEVRCVMHVHQKRCDTRVSYKSLLHIAKAMYEEAKAMDDKLPMWNKLKGIDDEQKASLPSGSLREIRKDGLVADSEMMSRGFVVGAKLVKKDDQEQRVHQITSLGDSAKTITVNMMPNEEDEEHDENEEKEPFEVDRHEVLSSWAVYEVKQEECFSWGDYPNPSIYSDLLIDVWKGHIKSALIQAFNKSSEESVAIYKTKVVATKHFKEGSLHLVGLTNNILISNKDNSRSLCCLGDCFDHPSGMFKAYARPHLVFPAVQAATGFARSTVEPFLAAYWACTESMDISKTNSKATLVEANLKIGTTNHKIGIPTIINIKPLSEGEEIVVQKSSAADEPEQGEPDAKRQKTAKGKKGKGKGKGKAKASK